MIKKSLFTFLLFITPSALAIISEQDKQFTIPRNIIRNGGFESGKLNWTSSGGSFTITTTAANVSVGSASGIWDPSANAQTLTATAVAIPAGYYSRSGLAYCTFKTNATDTKLQVTDGTNVLTELTIPASSTYQKSSLNFVFPSSGNINLRLQAQSDSAAISIDECYIGEASNLAQVTQSQLWGGATWPPTASCLWTTSSTSYTNYSADSDCTTPAGTNLRGFASAPSTKVPGITFASLPPGKYHIVATGVFSKTTANNAQCYWRIHDGTSAALNGKVNAAGTGVISTSEIIGDFEYTTAQSNVTFQVQVAATAGTITCDLTDSDTTYNTSGLSFQVYRFPSNADTVYRPDQVGWIVDANISGANPSLGTSSVAAYTDINDASLTLTKNSGSIPVGIACSTPGTETQEVGDTTCTGGEGNESLGITFNLPTAGTVMACAAFSWNAANGAGGAVQAIFEMVETPNNATSITQEGKSRVEGDLLVASSGTTHPFPELCGVFNFTSSGQKTIRLYYEQNVSGTVSTSQILADAGGGVGQRDVHFVVYPINQSTPQPLIMNSVTTNYSGQLRIETAKINCDGSSVITTQTGTWLSTISNISSGTCTLTFSAGMFSSAPVCTATMTDTGGTPLSVDTVLTSSSAQLHFFNTTTGANAAGGDAVIMCVGPK